MRVARQADAESGAGGGEGGGTLHGCDEAQARACASKGDGSAVEREKVVRDVQLPEAITVSELANRMAERVSDVVKALMNNGIMATQNQID